MEVEVKAKVSFENGTKLSYTVDGKDMDLTVKKNRADATIIFTSAMTLLNAVCGDDEEEKKTSNPK